MENRPPQQDTPRRPPNQRAQDQRFRRVTDSPLALVVIARRVRADLLAVRAQDRRSGSTTTPWFLDQVKNNNIKTISFQGIEIHGELRDG